jgi:hypothetical protein
VILAPAFRLRIYAPRSVDATEATVLTPRAGAAHSDAFQVASIAGVSGYQPYLDLPTGRKGRFDPLTRQRDVGAIDVCVLDKRTEATSNLTRWMTAFVANVAGQFHLQGLKAQLDLSTDGGSSWATYYTGRVHRIVFDDTYGLKWRITIREMSDELTFDVFGSRPHGSASSASVSQLWPIAPSTLGYGPWGAMDRQVPMKVSSDTSASKMGLEVNTAVAFDASWNVMSAALRERATGAQGVTPTYRARARVKFTSGALSGQTKEYWLGMAVTQFAASRASQIYFLECLPVHSADPAYAAPQAVAVTCLVSIVAMDATDNAPIYIDTAHPVQILKDILDGYYGTLNANGTVARTYPYDASSFTALLADATIPTARFVVTKRWKAIEFIEQQLLAPFGLGYRLNAAGQVVVFDARVPASLAGLVTLGEADMEAGSVSWEQTREGAISRLDVTYYEDKWLGNTSVLGIQGDTYEGRPTLIESFPRTVVYTGTDFGAQDVGAKTHAIDATGLRTTPLDNDKVGLLPRSVWLARYLDALAEDYRRPWATGPSTITARLRRTATVNALAEGQVLLVDLDAVPDAASTQRGGVRLARILELTDNKLTVEPVLLDLGRNAMATSPTIGTLGTDASDDSHLVTVPITLNAAGEDVEVWYNVTATSVGARPADTDAGWTFGQRAVASSTYILRVPSGARVWVRARSVPVTNEAIPSAWAYASTYQDTAALTAPTLVSVTVTYSQQADVAWTNGSAKAQTEVALDAAFVARIALLDPGVTRYTLRGLTASTVYTVYLRHVDPIGGGVTAATSGEFSTGATAAICPAMSGIVVLTGKA